MSTATDTPPTSHAAVGAAMTLGFAALMVVVFAYPSRCCMPFASWMWPALAVTVLGWAEALRRAASRAPAKPGALFTGLLVTAVSLGLSALALLATPRPHFPHRDEGARPPVPASAVPGAGSASAR